MTPLFWCSVAIVMMASLFAAVGPVAAMPLGVRVARLNQTAPVRALEPVEFIVTIEGGKAPYANPFDAQEIAVDATLRGPQGRQLQVPGFWQQPYERVLSAEGRADVAPLATSPAAWRVRICPPLAGQWQLAVTARDASGRTVSSPFPLTVLPKTQGHHGFIERAQGAGRARYFQYGDGTPYFAVGENLCWSGGKGLIDYERRFAALGNAGANYARLWMANRPLESQATGLGHYDQGSAAYFDQVLGLAQKQGIACMLAFGTFGEFTTGGFFNEGKWSINPYNALNGGPVAATAPNDFFTDLTARQIYRNRLRYIVARYSAYTSVGFWELWNEKDAPAPWVEEMATLLKTLDPYHRPVTNSFSTTGPAAVWNLTNIDLSQTHRYGDDGSMRDIATGMAEDTRAHDAFAKPHLMGEFGISWRGDDTKFDPHGEGTNMHNGLWSSALAGNAGSAMMWWWDSYVEPQNLYPQFTPLARFAGKIDWPHRAFEPLSLVASPRTIEHEEWSDLRLESTGAWGAKPAPVAISADGWLRVSGSLISYFYNVTRTAPDRKDFQGPQELNLTMPKAGVMRLFVGTVSVGSKLQVSVDGKVANTFDFDASPAGVGTYKQTKSFPEYGGIYQARFDVVREVPLGAGPHRIVLENVSGDWMQINGYEFSGMQSSRFVSLRTLALQDRTSGETLVWLQDPNSNWQSDRDGKTPVSWEGVTLAIPVPHPTVYQVEWWDTRLGRTIGAVTTRQSKNGQLALAVPPFTRDVALRIVAVKR